MEEIIKTFYVDWHLVLAQMFNFVFVLVVLYLFAVKPLMKLMHERSQRIDEGLKNAEAVEEKLKKIEIDRQQEVKKGRKEAQAIILTAEKDAEEVRRQKIDKAKKETEKIVTDAKAEIQNERTKMMHDVRNELGELVMLASGKIASGAIDEKQHEKLISTVIEDLKKS
jgi:F-type H+-transporting ATPase subunit b